MEPKHTPGPWDIKDGSKLRITAGKYGLHVAHIATTGMGHAAHESHGGYLLCIGSRPPEWAVCDREQAVHCWGRTEEQMADLGQNGFSES